jgi:hypothetical protein
MSEAKDALIAAIEKSADALEAIVGDHTLPGPYDVAGQRRVMNDRNFNAKWKLVFPVEIMRSRAKSLRRNDIKQGDWPPFRPEDAAEAMEMIEQVRTRAGIWTKDRAFVESVAAALNPIRDVVRKYAV